ncbi:MAG: DUF4412 domain-containing protein [Dehalococcoidia bacterium]|jgi:outer membrane lipoprotein-sorting protein
MKKIVSLLLVLVVALGCVGLAACGGDDDGATTPDNGASQPADSGNGGNGGDEGDNGGDGEDLGDIVSQGAGIDSVSYTMETTAPGTPMITTQMWVEGNNIRMEMDEQGQHIIYLSNYSTGKAYMYMPDQNMALEMDISQMNPPDYEAVQDIPDYNYTIVGTETMDGKVCLVVEYSAAGATVKSWIWKQHGFPIRTESTTSEGKIIVVFKDIDFGDINDSLFELPEGVQIIGS